LSNTHTVIYSAVFVNELGIGNKAIILNQIKDICGDDTCLVFSRNRSIIVFKQLLRLTGNFEEIALIIYGRWNRNSSIATSSD